MVLYVARTFLTPFTGRTRDGPSGRNLFFNEELIINNEELNTRKSE